MILLVTSSPLHVELDDSGADPHAYVLEVELATDSDWCMVTLTGLGRVIVEEDTIHSDATLTDFYVSLDRNLVISVGKPAYDMDPVVVSVRLIVTEPDEELNLRVTKGHIGKAEVSINGWGAGGFSLISRFVHDGVNEEEPDENPAVFTLGVDRLEGARVRVGFGRLPVDVDRLALALHYPWYGSPGGPAGGWFHWQEPIEEGSIASSTHYPLFGPYDSNDEELITTQILLAQDAGLDGFVSSWRGPGTFEDAAFSCLLDVAEGLGFKVSIYYESVRFYPDEPLSVDGVVRELAYALQSYSDSGAFLKVGRVPVVFIYNIEAHDRLPGYWSEVRRGLEEEVGDVILIGDFRDVRYLSVFDGVHFYNEFDLDVARGFYGMFSERSIVYDGSGFDEAVRDIEALGELPLSRKVICGTVVPGYDDHKIRSPGKFVDRLDGGTYDSYWRLLDEFPLDWALISTWNEWHEGTEIEPSLEYGFQYLEMTRFSTAGFKGIAPHESPKPVLDFSLGGFLPEEMELRARNTGEGPALAVRAVVTSATESSSSHTRTVDTHSMLLEPGESQAMPVDLRYLDPFSDPSVSISYYSLDGVSHVLELRPVSAKPGDFAKYMISVGNGTHQSPVGWLEDTYLNYTSSCTLEVRRESNVDGEIGMFQDELNTWSRETKENGLWPDWFVSGVEIGESIDVMGSAGSITGSETLKAGPYSADCWRLEVPSAGDLGDATIWFDMETGLMIRTEVSDGDSETSYVLSSTNVLEPDEEVILELRAGWNMISIPLLLDDSSVDWVLRDVDLYHVLTVEGSVFLPADRFEAGSGYYLFVIDDVNVTLNGAPVERLECDLRTGWNMVGGLDHEVLASEVFPEWLQLMAWDRGGMTPVDVLEPYKGYWVLSPGDITIDMVNSKRT